nr:hypothetical protein StreXyl84_77310 [Streptomyces sp. Xyl84]
MSSVTLAPTADWIRGISVRQPHAAWHAQGGPVGLPARVQHFGPLVLGHRVSVRYAPFDVSDHQLFADPYEADAVTLLDAAVAGVRACPPPALYEIESSEARRPSAGDASDALKGTVVERGRGFVRGRMLHAPVVLVDGRTIDVAASVGPPPRT